MANLASQHGSTSTMRHNTVGVRRPTVLCNLGSLCPTLGLGTTQWLLMHRARRLTRSRRVQVEEQRRRVLRNWDVEGQMNPAANSRMAVSCSCLYWHYVPNWQHRHCHHAVSELCFSKHCGGYVFYFYFYDKMIFLLLRNNCANYFAL
jgi:hypothetical protein